MSCIGGFLGKLTTGMLFENWHCGGRRHKKNLIAETDYRKNFARFKKRTIVKICIFWIVGLAGFVSTSRVLIGVGVFFHLWLWILVIHIDMGLFLLKQFPVYSVAGHV